MTARVWIGDIAGTVRAGNADVIVTLDDGRAYSFTAFTPEALRAAMSAEGLACFVCTDLMVLSEITQAGVLAALDEMDTMGGLDRFGIPQNPG